VKNNHPNKEILRGVFPKTFIYFIAISLVPQIIILVSLYKFSTQKIENEINIRFKNISEDTISHINSALDNHRANIVLWSNMTIPKVGLTFNRPEGVAKFFDDLLSNYGKYNLIVLADKNGNLFSSSQLKKGSLQTNFNDKRQFNFKNTQWFQKASKGNVYVSDWAYSDVIKQLFNTDLPVVQISSPVYSETKSLLGVISVFVDWGTIQGIIDHVQNNYFSPDIKSGYAFLIKKDSATIIAHSDRNYYGKKITDLKLNNLKSSLLEHKAVFEYKDNGQTKIASCVYPDGISLLKLKWILCSTASKSDIYSEVTHIQTIIVILMFFTVILVLYFSIRYSRKITAPILKLKDKTEKILCLKEFNPSKYEINSGDEIEDLDKAFNAMLINLRESQKRVENNAKFAFIGQTTAMLAHDVRKPFSMLKIVLSMFDKFNSMPSLLERSKADIEKAITNVESMLGDIMDFSREVRLEAKPNSVFRLLDFSIRQTAQEYQHADISLEYDIQNKQKPLADDKRLARVFSNIISNAIEAITTIGQKEKGDIFISTDDVKIENRHFVEIIIANNGPQFDDKDIPNLFESFFTKGKRKGTGLGLASAYKIVALHDGTIKARNMDYNKAKMLGWQQNEGVELVIDVPASNEQEQRESLSLPNNIKDAVFVELKRDRTEIDKLIEGLSQKQKSFKVLLLEDEALYRASVKNIIKKNEKLSRMLTLYDVTTMEEGLEVVRQEGITHAIVDIDLGDLKDGFDFIKKVKNNYPNIVCMVHSNRHLEENKIKANELGAKAFVPKPLNIEHLVLFLSDTGILE